MCCFFVPICPPVRPRTLVKLRHSGANCGVSSSSKSKKLQVSIFRMIASPRRGVAYASLGLDILGFRDPEFSYKSPHAGALLNH
jgi:hypothetical protein